MDMSRSWPAWIALWVVVVLSLDLRESAFAAESGISVEAAPGDSFAFSVERVSRSEGESSRGTWTSEFTSVVRYGVKVMGRKAPAQLELAVTYLSVTAKREARQSSPPEREGDDASWSFDSSKQTENDDETGDWLREVIKSTILVSVDGAHICEMRGFPEPRRGERDRRRSRSRWLAAGIASRSALQRDLDYILSTPVLGKEIERGQCYTYSPERSEDGKGRGRRLGRFGGRARTGYTFKGRENVRDVPAAKFALSAVTDERRGADHWRFPRQEELSGWARVSLRDGLVLELKVDSKEETKGARQGQKFRFGLTSSVHVTRLNADDAATERRKSP